MPSPLAKLNRLQSPSKLSARTSRRWHMIAAEYYQRANPGVPWMPRQAVDVLAGMLRPGDHCLEWGSGHSTAWLVGRTASVISVEHDSAWLERVRREVKAVGGDPESVRFMSIDVSGDPAESPYVRIVDEFEQTGIDVCYVDDEHRPACMLAAIPKLNSGGLLILDDAQLFLDRHVVAGSRDLRNDRGSTGKGALTPEWQEVASALRDWRVIWCASDAAIWIKP
jgi:predicted O-methyltransferase YrrM